MVSLLLKEFFFEIGEKYFFFIFLVEDRYFLSCLKPREEFYFILNAKYKQLLKNEPHRSFLGQKLVFVVQFEVLVQMVIFQSFIQIGGRLSPSVDLF